MALVKKIVLNRYFITLGTILMIIFAWNMYVIGNNGGIITGIVTDDKGNPVSDATVSLYVAGSAGLLSTPLNAGTDGRGEFTYTDHELIEFTIDVDKDGFVRSEKQRYHTLFRKQNFQIPKPIVLIPSISP